MMTKNKLVSRSVMTLMAIFMSSALFAQVAVTGIVIDENEEPVIGASILVKGTTSGTVSDFDGNFALDVADANATLVVSYVGLETQEVALRNRKVVNVKLVANTEVLDELVVVGYGSMKKSDLSGATVSMKEEDLKNQITTSLDQAFAGKAAGVTAVQTSGAPGSSSSIRVRGQSTVNAGAEPLYVVDGVILQGSGNSGFDYGLGDLGNGKVSTISPIATLNPQDIVSMEILKDASATAIYGAQGANGVVLITTKHGKEGKAQFSYDGMVAWSQQNKRLDMMNLREFAQFQNDLVAEGEMNEDQLPQQYRNPAYLGEGTNWQDAIFQTGFQHQHQIAAQGGTEKVHYYLSGSYMDQKGTIIGSEFNRFSVRSNIDAQLTKWLKVGLNATYSTTNEDIKLADSEQGIVFYSLAANPEQPIYDVDGNFYVGQNREGAGANRNPVALAMLNSMTLKRQKLMGNIFLEIQPIKQLTFRSDFGFDVSAAKSETYKPTFDFGYWKQTTNSMNTQRNNSTYWQIKNYLTYADSKAGHSWSVMVGQEAWRSDWEYLRGTSSNLPSDDIHNVALGDPTTMSVGQGFGTGTMVSAYARATYNYGERYYLTYTFRYDGSSNFGPKNRWAPFNSLAVSWRFSNEKFFEPIHDAWSNGKLRFGWGQTGNSNIGAFAWGSAMSSIFSGAGTPNGNTIGYRPANMSNPFIHWERQEQFNVGLDLGFINDKIMLNADYYYKVSNDMLMDMQLPSYMGTSGNGSSVLAAPKGNYGSILNQGVEISLDINPFRGKKVEWESNVQISVNRNKLLSLDGTANAALNGKGQWDDIISRTLVGESLYNFYGYEVEGIYQSYEDIMNSPTPQAFPGDGKSFTRQNTVWVGDLKFKDVNGDGKITEDDKTNIGSPLPKFTFGWTNTLRFFGVDLTVFLNGSYGNKILNYTRMGSSNSNTSISSMKSTWTNQLRDVVANRTQLVPIDAEKAYPCEVNGVNVNYWYDDITNVKAANPNAKEPRASINADPNNNCRVSSRYVEDGSYLRIKNVVLGYTLPKKVLKKMHFDNFRVYLNIQNLATFTKYTGYDPEVGASTTDPTGMTFGVDLGRYPSPTTYALGLNIAF